MNSITQTSTARASNQRRTTTVLQMGHPGCLVVSVYVFMCKLRLRAVNSRCLPNLDAFRVGECVISQQICNVDSPTSRRSSLTPVNTRHQPPTRCGTHWAGQLPSMLEANLYKRSQRCSFNLACHLDISHETKDPMDGGSQSWVNSPARQFCPLRREAGTRAPGNGESADG